jgi:hypothetical protein
MSHSKQLGETHREIASELDIRSGRHGTGDPALRWEVARVRRLGRQVNCVIVLAHPKLRPARKREHWASHRGRTNSSPALVFLAPASSSPSCDQADIQLVFGAVTAQPVENRLARPIRSPPSSRRACAVRWSQVIHRFPPLL